MVKKIEKVTNNDYLAFNNLRDLERYAQDHKIFDNDATRKFQRDYVSHLADDGFNEHYYLNKEYDGKTPLEILNERNCYLAGIERLRIENRISPIQAEKLKNDTLLFIDRENKHRDGLILQYHSNLCSKDNPLYIYHPTLLCSKINNVVLNEKVMNVFIDDEDTLYNEYYNVSKPKIENLESKIFFETANSYIAELYPKLNETQKENFLTFSKKMNQSRKEREDIAEMTIPLKDHSLWLFENFEDVLKKTAHITDPAEKEEAERKIIGALPFTTDLEKDSLKGTQNENTAKINKIRNNISKTKWYSFGKRRKLRNDIRVETEKQQKFAVKQMNILRNQRFYEYEKMKRKIDLQGAKNLQEALWILEVEKNNFKRQEIFPSTRDFIKKQEEYAISHTLLNVGRKVSEKASQELGEDKQQDK